MAMPASGPISFLQLQNEFGGANPIGIIEYYRTALVPGTNTTTVGQWVAYSSATSPLYQVLYFSTTVSGTPSQSWYFNDVLVASATSNTTSQTAGGALYGRGTLVSTTNVPENSSGKVTVPAYTLYEYKINRWEQVSTTVNVNTGVPASGTISMSQFYGAQDY